MTDSTTGLRAATAADGSAVLGLLRMQVAEETPAFPFAASRVSESFNQCLHSGAVILALDDGRPVGTAGILLERPWWSDRAWLRLIWVFVRRSHRRETHLHELLTAARAAARTAGTPLRVDSVGDVRGKTGAMRRAFGAAGAAGFLLEE